MQQQQEVSEDHGGLYQSPILCQAVCQGPEENSQRKGEIMIKLKGGEANFSFRDFKPDFLHQYLLKS